MTDFVPLNELIAEWSSAKLLYPLYLALAREFVIDTLSCPDLETSMETPPQESVEQARQWLLTMDERIQVHQLRQFLQTTALTNEDGLRKLLLHHLRKKTRSESDRDKIDFLLVQLFSHLAPSRLQDGDVHLDYVAQILEPFLGTVDITRPTWLEPIDQILSAASACHTLSELLDSAALDRGRKLKVGCGDDYFQPIAMVAFARFSFLMRRVFFRLMHGDLNAILDGLRELERHGIVNLDCRRAQFSADEPIARLRMICQSWKVMFHAEYSSGQPLRMLVDLRSVVDSACARLTRDSAAKPANPPIARAHAAAAGAGAAASASDVPEFEVSAGSHHWDPEDPVQPASRTEDNGDV